MTPKRVLYYAPIVDEPIRPPYTSVEIEIPPEVEAEQFGSKNVRWRVDSIDKANLVSSLIDGEDVMHAPVLDLDGVEPVGVVCLIQNWLAKRGIDSDVNDFAIIPSTRPQHFHLFCDVAISWDMYRELLVKLQGRKMLEEGYVGVSIAREATYVRKPGHLKPEAALENFIDINLPEPEEDEVVVPF